jgi:hypothetical protein
VSAGIDIVGLAPLLAALEQFPAIVGPELERTTRVSLLMVVADLKQYPPEPAGSTYRRTNNLARGWSEAVPSISMGGAVWEAKIVNTLARKRNGSSYGPYVQDEAEQAPVHMGRWATTQDVLEQRQTEIEAQFAGAAQRIAAKLEGGA